MVIIAMKKIIKYISISLLLIIILKILLNILITEKNKTYEIISKNKKYKIVEHYKYKNKKHYYDIKISNKKDTYYYSYNKKLTKKTKILKKIETYEKDNYKCIFPIFKDNNYKIITCTKEGKIYSYTYLKNKKETIIDEFEKILIEKGYKLKKQEILNSKTITDQKTKLNYYDNYIGKYNILIWKYDGAYLINNNIKKIKLLKNNDIYETEKFTTKIENNYLVMNIDETNPKLSKIYIIDVKKQKINTINLKNTLSTESYFNGVYEKKAYITDQTERKQYQVNIKKKSLDLITENKKDAKYYNGKSLEKKDIEKLSIKNLYFKEKIITDKKLKDKYKNIDIKKSNNHYYFKTEDGNIFFKQDKTSQNEILLFNMKNIKEWQVINEDIFLISNDTLYRYNMEIGLQKIIKYKEFLYHTKSMYVITE